MVGGWGWVWGWVIVVFLGNGIYFCGVGGGWEKGLVGVVFFGVSFGGVVILVVVGSRYSLVGF